jgi:hypothetical protein
MAQTTPVTTTARRPLGVAATALALALVGMVTLPLSAARASALNLNSCTASAVGQPFAPWGDPASYELAPGGDFESPAWSVQGGAKLVAGSEPYAATGTLGSWSLSLPAGSSAQSPSSCVDAASPTIRMFIAGTGSVAVTVVDGASQVPAGTAVATGDWAPTPVMLTSSALLGALSGGTAQVSVRVTAVDGAPRVDDVFIDPWNRG